MKSFLLIICFVLAILTCSDASAQCGIGNGSLPGSRVVRAAENVVRTVARARPFRRGWFSRRNDRG